MKSVCKWFVKLLCDSSGDPRFGDTGLGVCLVRSRISHSSRNQSKEQPGGRKSRREREGRQNCQCRTGPVMVREYYGTVCTRYWSQHQNC
uniref:hypothetical protein n=1 Tax=Candidatus Cryptobacteroides bacterium TaxID=3085639 RepID=UPI004026B4D1